MMVSKLIPKSSKHVANTRFVAYFMRTMSTESRDKGYKAWDLDLSNEPCPQGIQGDDCVNFKLWLENCQRYGMGNCNQQLQGIQTGRKTLAEVIAEQDELIARVAEEYAAVARANASAESLQGVQGGENIPDLPRIDQPCPQGIQGEDCARFNIWLQNCHKFGMNSCGDQLAKFKRGEKTLQQLFADQEQAIAKAVQNYTKNRRDFSTSASLRQLEKTETDKKDVKEEGTTQRQKLKYAIQQYGSTVMVFHITISLASLGLFYLLVSSGVDLISIMSKLGVGETILQSKVANNAGTFVVAYAVHKIFAPVRIATTLACTPLIVRYLRGIGILKKPKV